MIELILSQLVGLILGVGASFLCWWILFHKFVPKIEFSDKISILPNSLHEKAIKYRVKIQNVGNRKVIDAEFRIKLRIKALMNDMPYNWQVFNIKTKDPTPFINVSNQKDKNTFGGMILYFEVNHDDQFLNTLLPQEINDKAKSKTLTIEDVLKLPYEKELNVIVYGYDEFSGTRKMFVSKNYKEQDIQLGIFQNHNLDFRSDIDLEAYKLKINENKIEDKILSLTHDDDRITSSS